ncbi:MAG: tryptophan halogenase [Gammaproteobacteria bacterium]|nr:MAG: tryptophan halogenase [Gammaproteobacteria bacterium]
MINQSEVEALKQIIIVGGGSAGWMTAAALTKVLGCNNYSITVIESDTIGTVSVGEATIPHIRAFNSLLEIDEDDFLKHTHGTFKLGIEFVNWKEMGHSYMHPFGAYGTNMHGVPFHHYWLKSQKIQPKDDLLDYCLEGYAAKKNLFSRPLNYPNTPLTSVNYAFHFDATLYAAYLRTYSEKLGASRIEGIVTQINTNNETGFIESLLLENGALINGDLFIDCTGFKGLLIDGVMESPFEDWSQWLPCNSAIAHASESLPDKKPYTISTAQKSGWQWQIPLQNRIGNGHVYSSDFLNQDDALTTLFSNLPSKPMGEPNFLKWTNGKRKKLWVKNCVAIGLSGGFIEPLESTGLQLIQASIERLLSLFPNKSFQQKDIDIFNENADIELKQIRDFIVLHYKLTTREDSPFWKYCKEMSIPDTLQSKIELYKTNGRVFRENNELFAELSWLSVLSGQGIIPQSYHPLVDNTSTENLHIQLSKMKEVVRLCSKKMPTHAEFITKHCSAS